MRRFDDHLLLSPSDLNDLLECRHLMALELAAVQRRAGARAARAAPTPRSSCATASSTSRRSWRSSRREGRPGRADRDRRRPRTELREARRADHATAMRRRRRGDPPGRAGRRRRRRLRRLPGAGRPARRELGDWSYEVADAKLARITKPTSSSSSRPTRRCSSELQGHAAGGAGRAAGRRHARHATAPPTSPPTCERCAAAPTRRSTPASATPTRCPARTAAICGYRRACEQRRVDDDHLSLVAGLRRDQVARAGGGRRAHPDGAGRAARDRPRCRGCRATRWPSCARQAALQLQERVTGEQRYELLALPAPATASGCCRQPADGDLFFDIEGDPYIGDKGLEYLFGVGWLDDDGSESVPAVLGARPRRGAARVRGS